MSKVIVERPRRGSSRHVPRRGRRLDAKRVVLDEDDLDPFPSRIGHSAAAHAMGRGTKWFNENLAPLRRFLLKQAGRPWNAVWSEISEHLRPTSTVQQHVRDHVADFVGIRTLLIDGEIHVAGHFGQPEPLSGGRHGRGVLMYVDPVTGILHINPKHETWAARRRREKAANDAARLGRWRRLGPNHLLLLLDDGNWWEVRLARTPCVAGFEPDPRTIDVIEHARLSTLARGERYGADGVHAVAKRPLSKRELKRHALR
jgi:hypothetical protein